MTIAHREKVAVFETTKMRDCDPIVLVLLVGIWRGHSSLGSKCKFCNSICRHLLWISIWKSVFFVFNRFLYWGNWVCLGLALMNTIVLTLSSVAINFLYRFGCNICWLRGFHLNLMTSCFIFLNKVLYLSWKWRIISIVNHISIWLRSFMRLSWSYNPFIFPTTNTTRINWLLLLSSVVLLMTEWSFMCCSHLYLLLSLFLRFIGFLTFLLLRYRFLNAVSAPWYCFILLLCPWLIVRDLAWDNRH